MIRNQFIVIEVDIQTWKISAHLFAHKKGVFQNVAYRDSNMQSTCF